MIKSIERSYIGPRNTGPITMSEQDVREAHALDSLGLLGINLPAAQVTAMAAALAMDDQQGGVTTAGVATPVQFLQTFLPGFVRVITAARKIDELIGLTTVGSWEDEEVVQGVLEPIGNAVPYGDYTNVPLASWNSNFERRTVIRFEKGIKVGMLEEARAARVRINSAAEKRSASALALEIERNKVGFYGYNSGNNRTYGFLNDPGLGAYGSVPNGAGGTPTWATKSFLEITGDIRTAFATLQNQSQDTISIDSKMTLGVPTVAAAYLTTVSQFGNSVMQWIKETFPNMRVVSAPQLNAANGGANVFYLFAESVDDGASDNSRVWDQVVPSKFQALGVEKQSKAYVEDYANATAGVMAKRPYAIVRYSGI